MSMFLLLLQMLLVSWLGRAERRPELKEKKRRILHPLSEDGDTLMKHLMDNGETPTETNLFMAHLLAEMESRKQEEPKFVFPHHSQMFQDFRSWLPTSTSSPTENTKAPLLHPHRRRETKPPFRRDAKKFWDLFMLKTKSRSEEIVLPIKTIEMEQEICNTIPFSQVSIVHESCEKLEIQNNLCFGRCSSFHVPGPEDRIYTFCSHCLPIKFSMKRLEMNCTMATPVSKVVMIVEECKCVIQKTKGLEVGYQHSDLQANVYDHN
uniref:Cerberus 1, DAN family BMP antagonist n=1 Tax=Salvator merianae TaxID=96440 RepID=A0A8D0BSQ3_SALMN